MNSSQPDEHGHDVSLKKKTRLSDNGKLKTLSAGGQQQQQQLSRVLE